MERSHSAPQIFLKFVAEVAEVFHFDNPVSKHQHEGKHQIGPRMSIKAISKSPRLGFYSVPRSPEPFGRGLSRLLKCFDQRAVSPVEMPLAPFVNACRVFFQSFSVIA